MPKKKNLFSALAGASMHHIVKLSRSLAAKNKIYYSLKHKFPLNCQLDDDFKFEYDAFWGDYLKENNANEFRNKFN